MSQLPRPRLLTHVTLLAAGLGAAQLLYTFLDIKVLALVSSTLAPVCMVWAGVVWALRDKAADQLIVDGQDALAMARANEVVAHLQRKFTPRAAWTAMLAALVGAPAASQQLFGTIWQGSFLLAGVALAEATYSYLLANHWDEQIRAERSRRRVQAIRDAEMAEAVKRLARAAPGATQLGPWVESGQELKASAQPH